VKGGDVRVRVTVRCYAELNEFLAAARRQRAFEAECERGTTVKDLLEGLGVPHTEIDLLLVNGEPAGFDRRVEAGDRVAAYPVFEAFDVAGVTRVRSTPLREVRFVLDGHLGRLASLLRLAGFDASCPPGATDAELAALSVSEARILLTRDQALLKRGVITHGSYVHATSPPEQLREVVGRFQLSGLARPFTRCTRCNGLLHPAPADAVAARVPPRSRERYDRFLECEGCGRIYWEGTHYPRLREVMEMICRLKA
jgi:uncharacterized protein with PIN domain/sulfur carrier protein ThiS